MSRQGTVRGGLLMIGLASLGWGTSTTLSAYALRQIQPTDLLLLELLSGGVLVWGAALLWARSELASPAWKAFAVLGLFEPGLTYLLANEGLRRDSAATAALLLAMENVWIVPLAAAVLGERVSRPALTALGLGLAGTVVIGLAATGGRDTPLGHVLILGATLAAATYGVLARRSASRAPALVGTSYQLAAATIVAVPLAVIVHTARGTTPGADLQHWTAAVAAGLCGVALPFLLFNRAVVMVRATIAAGVLNMIPLVGFASAVVFLGDRPRTLQIAGGAVILISVGWLGRIEAGRRDGPGGLYGTPMATSQQGIRREAAPSDTRVRTR